MPPVTVPRMHDDEIEVDEPLVRRLLADQMPRWADPSLRRVRAWGTDQVIYRLGDRMSVRLPKIGWADGQGVKEGRWLGVFRPHLPVEVPVPLDLGQPAFGYPLRWYVSPWLTGEHPTAGGSVDLNDLAVDLAAAIVALQRINTSGAPSPRPGRRSGRGSSTGTASPPVIQQWS